MREVEIWAVNVLGKELKIKDTMFLISYYF